MSQVSLINGITTTVASKPQPTAHVSSNTTQMTNDYGFFILTQGIMFAKTS